MTKRNIKLIYKQDKKRFKDEYKQKVKSIKKQKRERQKEYEDVLIKEGKIINPPKRPILEEIGNAITHGVGAVFGILAFILILINSTTFSQYFSGIIYSFGLVIMFTNSCLYHSFRNGGKTKRLFRRFDYLSIYLLIGGTFAPILLCFVGGIFGRLFFLVQWVIIIFGIVLISVFGNRRFKIFHTIIYFILGWCGLLLIPIMLQKDFGLFYYVLGGGILYSLGVIPFALKKKASHFIWHFFVLGGAITQFIGIYIYIF